MEYLNISGNRLRDKNFDQIKQYFSSFSLKHLNMAKCSLGDGNGNTLGECLATNDSVKVINISGNGISDIGFRSYINLFKINNAIESFDCSCNFITDITGKDFIKSLINNKSLKNINLFDNQLHDDLGNLIIEILEVNKTLTNINLNYNRIQLKTIEDINIKLQKNIDEQKNLFIPDLLKNIKELEFQPELFTVLPKQILEKKYLQNILHKKVRQDDKNFCILLENEKKKLEIQNQNLEEIFIEKKNIENEIL